MRMSCLQMAFRIPSSRRANYWQAQFYTTFSLTDPSDLLLIFVSELELRLRRFLESNAVGVVDSQAFKEIPISPCSCSRTD
jgi:hypothetical protein